MRPLVLLVAASLSLAACNKKPALIEVNDQRLDAKVLEMREQQFRLLQPNATRGQVAAGLVEGWVAAQVLAAHKKPVSRDDLVSERAKLEGDAKIARLYREVARIYGEDREAFLNVGLLPDIAVRRAHELFVQANAGATDSEKKAAALLRATQEKPTEFEPQAKEAGAELHTITIGIDGKVRDAKDNAVRIFAANAQADTESATKLYSIGQRSAPNSVLGVVLRTGGGHMLLKRMDSQGDRLVFTTAIFPQQSFGEWLAKEARTLQEDGSLRVCLQPEIKAEYDAAAIENFAHCP
jgi:hypothetical protein